jgi:hypothetical protein
VSTYSQRTTVRFRPLLRGGSLRAEAAERPVRFVNLSTTSVGWIALASATTVADLLAIGLGDAHGFMVTSGLVTWVFVAMFVMRDWLSAQLREIANAHEVSTGLQMQQQNATDREIEKLRRYIDRSISNQARIIKRLDHMAEEMGVDPVKLAEDRLNFARQRGSVSTQAFPPVVAPDTDMPANVLKLRNNN